MKPPPLTALDVNLKGVLYFARAASVYLRQNRQAGEDKSLLLLSSVAGFKESPGLFVYQVSFTTFMCLQRYLCSLIDRRPNTVCLGL